MSALWWSSFPVFSGRPRGSPSWSSFSRSPTIQGLVKLFAESLSLYCLSLIFPRLSRTHANCSIYTFSNVLTLSTPATPSTLSTLTTVCDLKTVEGVITVYSYSSVYDGVPVVRSITSRTLYHPSTLAT